LPQVNRLHSITAIPVANLIFTTRSDFNVGVYLLWNFPTWHRRSKNYRFSIKSLWRQFLQSRHHYVVALPEMDESKLIKTGVLELDAQDRVIRQHEKPDRPKSTWSCPPLYFLQASVRPRLEAFLNSSPNSDAPGYYIDYLCQTEVIYAFKLNASRLDIGSMDSYREADRIMRAELER
jgi:dTDP-glucose pyrophosphorylase